MNSPKPNLPADKIRQTALMLSGSFFFLVVMLALSLHNIVKGREPRVSLEEAMRHPLALPLAGIAVLVAVLSFVVKKTLTPPSSSTDLLRAQMQGEAADPARVARFFAAHIVSYALSESAGIFGFVLGISTGNFEVALPFFALSVILFAIHWPKTDAWK